MYKVIKKFRDKTNRQRLFVVGDVFNSDDEKRIENLLQRNLIEKTSHDFDKLTKTEIVKMLNDKEIEFKKTDSKTELIKLLGGD